MSKYKGLFTFDEDNHRYVPIAQADGIIDAMDYEPDSELAEPLIKDEKIRKAVRAWAEANEVFGASTYKTCNDGDYWYIRAFNDTERHIDIDLYGDLPRELMHRKYYTIAELCGEEEE